MAAGTEHAGLEFGTLDVAGVQRGYWLAREPGGSSGTLLMVLPGSGTSGKDMATGILLDMVLTESSPDVSGDTGASSGLEKKGSTRHYRGAYEGRRQADRG